MTNRTMLFCAAVLSLAALSLSMIPASRAVHAAPQNAAAPMSPMHSLTGVSFHSLAPGY